MTESPPTIDPLATARWHHAAPAVSPWLHEEVGRRMQERLQWIVKSPETWGDWEPVRGGVRTHNLVAERYPQARQYVMESNSQHLLKAQEHWRPRLLQRLVRKHAQVEFGLPPPRSLDMLWSNMSLHLAADPQQSLQTWAELIKPQGFLMFSCLGPDTVQELRQLYHAQGWPPPGHHFTDMHDLGDMLVQHGFAEPVMDMERIHLAFNNPTRLIQELREMGRNFHPQRYAGLRTPRWKNTLLHHLAQQSSVANAGAGEPAQPGITLTFEIIYGHAFKAEPKAKVQEMSRIALDDMKSMLRQRR